MGGPIYHTVLRTAQQVYMWGTPSKKTVQEHLVLCLGPLSCSFLQANMGNGDGALKLIKYTPTRKCPGLGKTIGPLFGYTRTFFGNEFWATQKWILARNLYCSNLGQKRPRYMWPEIVDLGHEEFTRNLVWLDMWVELF